MIKNDFKSWSIEDLQALQGSVALAISNRKQEIDKEEKSKQDERKAEFLKSAKGKYFLSKIDKLMQKLKALPSSTKIEIPLTLILEVDISDFKKDLPKVERDLKRGVCSDFYLGSYYETVTATIKSQKMSSTQKSILQKGLDRLLHYCCDDVFKLFGKDISSLTEDGDLNHKLGLEIYKTLKEMKIDSL